tara:strand:+ start:596 stop:748 length:153 start_codon:yes stop_codon:yes gene_type:complete
MPNVAGKKFPYTKAGKAAAKKAAKKQQAAKKKPASLMKRQPAAGNYSRGY